MQAARAHGSSKRSRYRVILLFRKITPSTENLLEAQNFEHRLERERERERERRKRGREKERERKRERERERERNREKVRGREREKAVLSTK